MRSRGMTALCILLGLLTIAGVGDSIVVLSGQVDPLPSWLGYLTLVFGITAGAAATGLWRMNRWGLYSLRVWFVACFTLVFGAAYVFYLVIPGGITTVALIALLLAGLFLALDRVVSSKTQLAT